MDIVAGALVVVLVLSFLFPPAVVVWTVARQLRMDIAAGGNMEVLDTTGRDPAPARVAELEAESARTLAAGGLEREHPRLRYGVKGRSPDLWLQSWVDPSTPLRAYLVTSVNLGLTHLDLHSAMIVTDVEGPDEVRSLVSVNMDVPVGDPATPLSKGIHLPGGELRMLLRLHRELVREHRPQATHGEQLSAEDQLSTGDRRHLEREVFLGRVREVEPGRYRHTLRGAVRSVSHQLPPRKKRLIRQSRQRAEELMVRLPPEVG